MNGAITDPWVATSKAPNNAIVTSMGASQNFLRTRRNSQNSVRKLLILHFFQNCRLILDTPPSGVSRLIQ
jgi:hypothetical protein